jgi:hypothetical protein
MKTHFEILIDASGSMGYMKGSKEYENKYLLPDKSTRTDLVKKIIVNNILPNLTHLNELTIKTFRGVGLYNDKGDLVLQKNSKTPVVSYNDKIITEGFFNFEQSKSEIKKIENPPLGGTPLYASLIRPLHNNQSKKCTILLLTDGDSNDLIHFDSRIIKEITTNNYNATIFIIGINQSEIAQKKCKRITDFTKGHYINLDTINYNNELFDSLLFELKVAITGAELDKIIAEQNDNTIVENSSQKAEKKPIKEDTNQETELEKKVAKNSASLELISTQLKNIVEELKYQRLSKKETTLTDDFVFDEDEEFNKSIGFKSEKHLLTFLKNKNWEEVIWCNEKEESGNPYDFKVFNEGKTYYIECKGSTTKNKEFFLTKNEWQFYLKNRGFYRLYFISEINSLEPTIIRIEDLLTSLETKELLPFSSVNRKLKADRTIFQIQLPS